MKLVDCHNHSNYSFDADFSVEDMVKSAIAKGLYAFAITDHCEINEFSQRNHPQPIEQGIKDIIELREKYSDKNITLLAGVEIGQPLHDARLCQEVLSLKGIDIVIASLHCVKGMPDYYYIDFTKMKNDEVQRLNSRYFSELLEIAKTADFDVLAHITYPFRYICKAMQSHSWLKLSTEVYDDQIELVLKALIERGKSLEINTSTLGSIGEAMPPERILKLYKQLGGELVSFGSDSHDIKDVARGIQNGYAIAQSIGFTTATYYVERKPITIKI